MLKLFRSAALASALTLSPAGIVAAPAAELKVVASFSIIADLARNVGGDRIEITTLVGPDGDAHVYEPKPVDASAVAMADVVLVNGLNFEGFLTRLVEASGTKASVVELSKGAEVMKSADEQHHHSAEENGTHDGHDHGAFDPHAWQSVANTEIYVRNIAEAFCHADAAGCDTYQANAEAYRVKLAALDGEIRATIASIPQDRRVVITSHDAFGYFGHGYGITFLAPEGVSTESEASAADVAALIRQIREDKAAAIFVENITNPRLIEQIASETGIKVGGALYSDALSDAAGPASTYIDMMKHNAAMIKGAVTGS